MKDEIKIITLGDIFENLETEEKAFKFKNYIINLQEQLHQASLDIQELTEKDIGCPSWCDKLTNLQEENERLKEWKEDLLKENIELENTRKKAIQFIKENDGYAISRNYYDNKLLNILNGGDEKC